MVPNLCSVSTAYNERGPISSLLHVLLDSLLASLVVHQIAGYQQTFSSFLLHGFLCVFCILLFGREIYDRDVRSFSGVQYCNRTSDARAGSLSARPWRATNQARDTHSPPVINAFLPLSLPAALYSTNSPPIPSSLVDSLLGAMFFSVL